MLGGQVSKGGSWCCYVLLVFRFSQSEYYICLEIVFADGRSGLCSVVIVLKFENPNEKHVCLRTDSARFAK